MTSDYERARARLWELLGDLHEATRIAETARAKAEEEGLLDTEQVWARRLQALNETKARVEAWVSKEPRTPVHPDAQPEDGDERT